MATFTLSGIVTETPPTTSTVLSGVVVTFVDGANQGRTGTTGADGRYQISGVVNGGFTVERRARRYTSVASSGGHQWQHDARLPARAPRAANQFRPRPVRVPTDIPAGRYYSDPSNGCHFQRVRSFGGTPAKPSSTPSSTSTRADGLVDLLPADGGFHRCELRVLVTTPRRGLLTSITPGMWIVGAPITRAPTGRRAVRRAAIGSASATSPWCD